MSTFYVDSSATGANDGSSWADAWTSMDTFSGNIVSGSTVYSGGVSPGDTVYISGGPTGSSRHYTCNSIPGYPGIWLPPFGTSGNPVTIKIGQDSAHNGTAIFDGYGTLDGTGYWLGGQVEGGIHDIIISGDAGDGARHFVLSNYGKMGSCDGYQNAYIGYVRSEDLSSGGIDFGGASGIECDHLYLKITATALACVSSASFTGTEYGTSSMHHCTIYAPNDNGSGPDIINWLGSGFDIHDNIWIGYAATYDPGYHMDGQQVQGGSYQRYWNNFIANMGNYAIYLDQTQADFSHIRIYNNIIVGGGGIIVGVDSGDSSVRTFDDIIIANNIVDGGSVSEIQSYALGNARNPPITATFTNCIVSNNIAVYNGGATNPFYFPGNDTTTQDDNITLTTTQAASDFVSYTADSITNDYRLLSDATDLIGNGADLSAYFITDHNGVTRSTWDIGAYKYMPANADVLTLNQTTNSSPVTELVKRSAVTSGVAGTLTEEVIHHSGDYPSQPANDYAYAKHGASLKHVYVFAGTLTLAEALASRDAI